MQHEPFHEQPWAVILFFLGMMTLQAVLGASRVLDGQGDWLTLIATIGSGAAALMMIFIVWQKISARRSQAIKNGNGQPVE